MTRPPRAPAPVEPPKPPRHARKHLTVEEWRRLRQAAAKDPRTLALLLLIYEAGLRREEPGQMRLSFLARLHQGQLYVWRQKGSLSGWIDVSRPTADALAAWVDIAYPLPTPRKRDSFVFPGGARRGDSPRQGITGRRVYGLYAQAAKDARLPAVLHHPHCLKATRVQHLLEHMTEQGLDPGLVIKSVAALVGHAAALTTVQHYVAATALEKARVGDFTKKMTGD